MKRLPKVKVSRPRKAKPILPAPQRPRLDDTEQPEQLTGQVKNMKASMPEERLAKELDKLGKAYEFRYTLGAPRGMPGWFEVDFVIQSHGQIYAIEVDTSFTHRFKGRADQLHDARVLKSLNKTGMQVYPQVIHLDGESDLIDMKNSSATVKRLFA